jgi:transcriptional regulator GlxA family with amidase domain
MSLHRRFPEEKDTLDIPIVPGGDVGQVSQNRNVLDWIVREDKKAEVLASVCTGAVLLAEAGLLDGGPATTHWGAIEEMRKQFPTIDMLSVSGSSTEAI